MTTPQNKTTCSEKVASFILATSTALMIGMTTPQNKTTCSEKVASFILATSTALMIGKNYRNWDIDWANSRQRN